jgi:hypothetical protein
MEINHFPLGDAEDNKVVKLLRIIFGIACIIVAAWWVYFSINTGGGKATLWVTIGFMMAFGFYQIRSGLGSTERYITISHKDVVIRKNSFLAPVTITSDETESIEIYPLSIIFYRRNKKKLLIRLGTVNYETNEKIIDELVKFAEANNILYKVIEENI